MIEPEDAENFSNPDSSTGNSIVFMDNPEDVEKRLTKDAFIEQALSELNDGVHDECEARVTCYIKCSNLPVSAKEQGDGFHDRGYDSN